MKKVGTLFLCFFKIGAFTFGGGYAMIALLENEFVSKRKWMTKDEFLTMVAIAESTPGPVAINSATYIGYQIAGVSGAVAATIAVCIPSFVIIFCISLFLTQFLSLKYINYAFKGIQVCVIYLIFSAGISMLKGLEKNTFNAVIIIIVVIAMTICSLCAIKFSSIYYLLICGLIGLLLYLFSFIKGKRGGNSL